MSRVAYTVTWLSGNDVGPELVAEASRAVEAASRLHGFLVHDEHAPLGTDALMRHGHPYPPQTRRAVLESHAALVAPGLDAPLDALEDDLDVRATITRVRFDSRSELSVVSPVDEDDWAWAATRAFDVARVGRAHVTLVGLDGSPPGAVEHAVELHGGYVVERMSVADALRALVAAPERFDVLLCAPEAASTLAEVTACTSRRRVAAWGRLAQTGPSLFGTTAVAGRDDAGHGVADPSAVLLAAALLLGEGLGERSAAATLTRALGRAEPATRPSTRGFGDTVLASLPLVLEVEHREVA